MLQENSSEKKFRIFSLLLFALLFCYVVLRSIFVEPVHDEIATLFHYIDYNTIWGKDIVMDANNHLLNSFLGKVCYSVFGDHIWAIRLPNVLSFILFFFSVYKITKFINHEVLKYSFLIAMTSIPYVLEYFSLARGYGMSMALMMFAIYQFLEINYEYSSRRMALIGLSLVLAMYANLNIVLTTILIFGFIGIKLLLNTVKTKDYKNLISYCIISILSVGSLFYAMLFAHRLKENGALYYGNKDGLWLTTGSSLSDLVLQTTSILVKYALIIILVGIISYIIYSWYKRRSKTFFLSPTTLFIGLFLGNLIAIELMRWLLDVNYPSDRVGMQLIFLLIASIIFILNEVEKYTWISVALILLPIVGYKHFNFIDSAFNPNERMEKADFLLFNELQSQDNASSATYTMLTYAYQVRRNNPTDFIVPEKIKHYGLWGGIFNQEIVSTQEERDKRYPNDGYEIVNYNSRTREKLLVREQQYSWKSVDSLSVSIPHHETTDIYYNIISNEWLAPNTKRAKIIVKTSVKTPELARETLVLVVDRKDQNQGKVYEYFTLNWASGKNKEYTFKRVFEFVPEETENLKIYLWNPNGFHYEIKDYQLEVQVVE